MHVDRNKFGRAHANVVYSWTERLMARKFQNKLNADNNIFPYLYYTTMPIYSNKTDDGFSYCADTKMKLIPLGRNVLTV